jgi:signal transduction histidine kinase
VPLIVDQIIEALESVQSGPTDRIAEISKPHGEVRFHQDYNVNELLIEYQLLRQIILKEVAAQLGRPLAVDEAIAINIGIDTALRRGVVTFVDHLTGQLKAADELQASYISYLNHDLRGGMNGILLMVEVLKRELASDPRFAETTDDLEAMRRAVLESVGTMDRFVFAHRLSRGKQQARFAPINVKSLVNDVISALKYGGADRSVEFTVDIPDECPLDSDRDLIRLIVQNVLGNTIKHSRSEGGKVNIAARPRQGGGCDFTIADEGPGIAPNQSAQLFAVSNNNAPGKPRQALKLGLPVSKMAADLIGAKLSVESVLGVGTTVRLEVPDRGIRLDSRK